MSGPVRYPSAPALVPPHSSSVGLPARLSNSAGPAKGHPPLPSVTAEDVGLFPMWYVARGYRDDNAKRIQTLKRTHPAAKDALAVYEQALQQADANDREIDAAIRDCQRQKRAQDETVSEMIARALYFYDLLSIKLDDIENA
jgi:hypothetical protein